MKLVMEKSWNMRSWPKVMEFCDSVMEFYQFCPRNYTNFVFCWVTMRKLSSDLESAFATFCGKMSQMQNQEERWKTKKWSWKSHGKIFCQVCGNPVGTLSREKVRMYHYSPQSLPACNLSPDVSSISARHSAINSH